MKKLFTFLMLAALVAMGFAQQRSLAVQSYGHYFGNVTSIDRSNWYGNVNFEGICSGMNANNAFYMVINAGEIPANATLERVCFGHYYSAAQGVTNLNYSIHLYRNPTIDESTHILTPGEEISNWDYTAPTTTDVVEVNIPTPYTVVADESLCIGVVFENGNAALALGAYDDERAEYYYLDAGQGPAQYVFGPSDSEERYPTPYVLAVYYNDGIAYVNQCDLAPAFLDPEEDGATRITSMAVRPDIDDALYCKMGVSNNGMDDFYGDLMADIYIESPTATESVYFLQADTISAMDSMMAGYIYSWQPFALFTFPGNDDPDYTAWEELQELGYAFPFELCMHITYTMAPNYNCIDNNAENDTYCITVEDANAIGITENTNTLTVSPNPASTILTVVNAAGAQISVYNIAGQEVMSVENAEANETLNVSNLNAGLYIVRVVNGNEVSTAKVSIVR